MSGKAAEVWWSTSGANKSCDVFLAVSTVRRWQLQLVTTGSWEVKCPQPRQVAAQRLGQTISSPATWVMERHGRKNSWECVIKAIIIPSLIQGLSLFQVNSGTVQKPKSPQTLRRKGWVIASAPLLIEAIILHQPAHKVIKLSISVLSSLHLLGYYRRTFLLWRLETT